ncbi:MAG: acyl-CoA reductase [Flavobacteriaceae bacterium]|nr:acyl-CoA reductase [Flavobacteriaceae bacterium]
MNNKTNNLEPFIELGHFLSQFTQNGFERKTTVKYNDLFFDGFKHQIKQAKAHNGWFTKTNVLYAIESWAKALTQEHLKTWLKPYEAKVITPKKVAIIMAGNIPLVGFHDFLAVLITGHHVLVKQSSNDKHLLPLIAKYLEYVAPNFKGRIQFTDDKLKDFDAVIATGSNNTARYFEHYFKNKPSIIRKNRNSIAIIDGSESEEQMKALSNDIFKYYGLGCRNVSKLFVPKNYDFNAFFQGIYDWHPIINDQKYANNYDYNKAVYLMSEFDMLENGFLMIKEDTSYASPIATVFYEYYDSKATLKTKIETDKDQIQCVVANEFSSDEIAFGQTQNPKLWDYADGIDTIAFLLNL